ncbi:CD44 antigen [Gracilinanus agilis]|uniref:CD44 antigen n=1 Tax=Gracilinanus agilis TaxID=191870 RepID=UPI001CFF2F6F|nr:CD44 antigen [Gracilinanus agilis]
MDNLWSRAIWGLLLMQLSLAQIVRMDCALEQQGLLAEAAVSFTFKALGDAERSQALGITSSPGREQWRRSSVPLGHEEGHSFGSATGEPRAMGWGSLHFGLEPGYGFIEGHVVIPRKTPRFLCAANNTGVYILASNTSLYDTYCFNASAPLDKEDCSSVSDIPSAFEGQVTIGIVNPDGTRYTKKGEYRTNPDDINSNYSPDDDVSSGSAGERSTMGSSTIIQTSYYDIMPTSFSDHSNEDLDPSDSPAVTKTHPIPETTAQEQHNWMWSWFVHSPPKTEYLTTAKPALTSSSGTTHETTAVEQEDSDWFLQWLWPSKRERQLHTTPRTVGMDSTTTSESLQPTEEREDETEKFPSYSGSGIDDDEDFVRNDHSSTTSATTRATSQETIGNQDGQHWEHDHQNPEEQPQATTEVTAIVDMNGSDDRSYGENSTQEPQHPFIFDGNHEDYDGHHFSSTTLDIPSSTTSETTMKQQGWFGWHPHPPKEEAETTVETTDTAPHHSTADPKEGWIEDYGTTDHSPMATPEQNHHESTSRPHTGLEDGHEHSTAPSPTSLTDGETDGNFPEDSTTPVEDSISNLPDTNENRTHSSEAHMPTGLPGMTKATVSGGFAPDKADPDDAYPHRPRRPSVTDDAVVDVDDDVLDDIDDDGCY